MPRRRCPPRLHAITLERQRYRCLYCRTLFGTVVYRGARMIVTEVRWDHRIPYAYLQANPDENWAAACQVCNSIKNDLLFFDVTSLRRWMRERWADLGFEVWWEPDVASDEDPERWAVSFASYLTRRQPDPTVLVPRKPSTRVIEPNEEFL
jgi:hypothetical protein